MVITEKDLASSRVDKDAIEEHLAGICGLLIAVPHDRGVADGDLVTLDVPKPETRRAYRESLLPLWTGTNRSQHVEELTTVRPTQTLTGVLLLLTGALLTGCSSTRTDPSVESPRSPSAVASATSAVEDAVALLEVGQRPWVMTVIGDSTGNEPDEWVFPVVTEIAERYDRPLTVHRWDSRTNKYIDDVTVGSGTNAPIIVWNGSASGKDGLYSAAHFGTLAPERPDMVIINHGHNMPTAEAATKQIKVLEQMLVGAWDDAPAVAVTIQNPRTDAGKAKMEALSKGIKDTWEDSSVEVLDVQSAFEASGNLPELLSQDGYHPSDAGHLLWANTVPNSLNARTD